MAVEGALRREKAGGFVDAIVGVYEDLIVGLVIGSMIRSLESELSPLLFLPILIVDDRSAVVRTVTYMPLIIFAVRGQEEGDVMEHCLSRNIVICPL